MNKELLMRCIFLGGILIIMALAIENGLFQNDGLFDATAEDGQVSIFAGNRTIPGNVGVSATSVIGTSSDATTSTSFVDMDDMSITVPETGDYLILFNANILSQTSAGVSNLGTLQLLKDSTVLTTAECGYYINGGDVIPNGIQVPVSMIIIDNLTAGQVIKVQWHTQSNGLIANTNAGDKYRMLSITPLN